LASQRDTLVGAGREALDNEMKRRGYDPDHPPSEPRNYARLFSTYTDEQLLVLASKRDTLHEAGETALDQEMKRRGFASDDLRKSMTGTPSLGDKSPFKVDRISRFFLRAPNWKIFLLLFLLYFFSIFFGFANISGPAHSLSVKDLGKPMFLSIFFMMMTMLCVLGWEWSLGSFLSRATHPLLSMKTRFFHFAVAYPAVYCIFFLAFFMSPDTRFFGIIIPFHLFAMYCLFYVLYFVSKSLVLAETSKPVSFYDYAGPFFLIWVFPVGIWIIQPRINRLYESTMNQFAKTSGSNLAL
jgi:hypothetical protein